MSVVVVMVVVEGVAVLVFVWVFTVDQLGGGWPPHTQGQHVGRFTVHHG